MTTDMGSSTTTLQANPSHDEWMDLARTEYELATSLVSGLSSADWLSQTDCTEWDVAAMVAHMLGAAESNASIVETVRQLAKARRWAKTHDRLLVDGLCAIQISERSHLSPAELIDRYRSVWPRALKRRSNMPTFVRHHIRVPGDTPGLAEKWTYGYLNDCIYTRDTWMHRVDISRATNSPMEVSASHDGRIVSDIVTEWAARHGKPFSLSLTGPAGGEFAAGSDGVRIELDAIEFARTLSGRATGEDLLAVPIPF